MLVRVCLSVRMCVCLCVHICMYAMYVCIYVYMYVCMYVCIYVESIGEDWCSSNWCTCDFGTWYKHRHCLFYFIHHSNSTFCLCFCKVSIM